MKKILYLAALSFAAAVMLVGLSGCPQKPKEELGNFKVSKLSFDSFKVDLEKLDDIPEANVKVVDFTLEADAPISSVSVNYDGKSFSASGSGKIFIGRLEELPIGRKVIAAFTVNSQGKNPVSFSFPITFNPPSVSFSKIYVDKGKSNSSADLSLSDGSCLIVSENDTATLSIESQMDLESVSVSVNSAAAQDATKVSPNKFTFNLSGLTSKTNVTVSASAPFKKPASYAFQVIKGMLKVGIKSIKVDGRDVSVGKALSEEGAVVEFDDNNVLEKGAAKIEVELEEAYTNLRKSAEPGFVAGSFKENSAKTSFSISTIVISELKGDPANPEVAPMDNTVSLELQAASRENAKIKLVLKNKIQTAPPTAIGLLEGNSLYYYSNYMSQTPAQGAVTFGSYGKYASVFMAKQGTDGIVAYAKKDNNGDWICNDKFEILGGQYSVFRQLIIGAFTGETGTFETIVAPPKDVKHAAVMIYIPAKKIADYGFSALFFDKTGQQPDNAPATWDLVLSPSKDVVDEIMGNSGKTYDIKKADFNDKAGYFQFTWRTPGVKITSAKFKKYKSDSDNFGSAEVLKEDNTCTVLCERGFYDFELGVGQGSTPINYESGKYYKYELKLMIEGESDEKTISIILKVTD